MAVKIRATQATLRRIQQRLKDTLQKTGRSLEVSLRRTIPDVIIREVEKELNAREVMEQIIMRRFKQQRESGFDGKAWKPLAKSTVRQRLREGFGGTGPILLRTGALLGASLTAVRGTYVLGRKPQWSFGKVQGQVSYAKYHQFGSGNRPPRRAFFNPPTAREMIVVERQAKALVRRKVKERLNAA